MRTIKKKVLINSNIDNRIYFDKYHLIFSNNQMSESDLLNINSIYEYPKIKKAIITLNATDLVNSRKNIRVSLKKTPETISIMRCLLRTLWATTTQSLAIRAYDKSQNPYQEKKEKYEFDRFIKTSIILHDKETLYQLADLLFFELNIFERYCYENVEISSLNPKTKEQIITISINLSEFLEIKMFDDVVAIDYNIETISLTINFVINTNIELII